MESKNNFPYTPLVSVITPVLNGAKYIKECINSALNQTYPNIEHIFIDGGSTDGTVDILQTYSHQHPHRIVAINYPKSGACEAWNKGLQHAKGDIIGWLGSDDAYKPDAVDIAVKALNDPNVYFVYGHMDIVDTKGIKNTRFLAKEFSLSETINAVCSVYVPSAFYRKEVVSKVGFLDCRYKLACDLDWIIRIGKQFPMHMIDRVLVDFRWHPESVSGSDKGTALYENALVARSHNCNTFAPRIRIYWFMKLSRLASPVLGPIYRSRLFNPILLPIVTLLVGKHKIYEEKG